MSERRHEKFKNGFHSSAGRNVSRSLQPLWRRRSNVSGLVPACGQGRIAQFAATDAQGFHFALGHEQPSGVLRWI